MRCVCPRCAFLVVDVAGDPASLVCPRCRHKFQPVRRSISPIWVVGVLAFLVVNLCLVILR